MGHKSEHLLYEIRNARENGGMSQRALSDRTGQTQSHISQIESGKMEPGLSSFIDMARALGLEVILVPRKLVPGVEALKASQMPLDGSLHTNGATDRSLRRVMRILKKVRDVHGTSANLDRLESGIQSLRRRHLTAKDMQYIHERIEQLERCETGPEGDAMLHEVVQGLQQLQNAYVHHAPVEAKAAYTLDDGEDYA